MPFALLIAGAMLLVTGVKGTQDQLYSLVQNDFTGSGSFIYWLAAIFLVGSLGYVQSLKGFSNAFLVLILVVLLIHQNPKTLFGNISTALNSSTLPQAQDANSQSAGNGGSTVNQLTKTASNLSNLADTDFIGNALKLFA